MRTFDRQFRKGDWVQVKSPAEIAKSLDANGTIDGLPFMPEMIQYCGKRFRISSRAFKTCVECFDKWRFGDIREFRNGDVWVLEGLRCSGAEHDGCQRGCLLFWNGAWLSKIATTTPRAATEEESELLSRKLKTRLTPERYFCQSTELLQATRLLSRKGRFRISVNEVLSRNSSLLHVLASLLFPMFWKAVHRYLIPRYVVGKLTKTPLVKLGLQPGETVEVKSTSEIAQTLSKSGCNRGLRYDHGLNKFCGARFKVRDRLDKMIVESTGKMVQLEGTVTLEGTCCLCYMSALGGCPRKDPIYWREAWLKRVTSEESRESNQKTMAHAS
jgi:hypothetical protein